MFKVRPKETVSMLTRDRIRLDADVYRPDAEGEFPVLLMRQPYGRAIASTVVYAHPIWYAAHGYIVVIQDVRGRGTSEGEFKLFAHEMEDGYDTVQWAASLPGSTGDVGMYGFSYQGMTQLYAAATRPPALKALCPAMIGYDLYADWAYENGAFCLQANLSWAIQLAAETARLKGDVEAHRMLATAAKNLPLWDAVPARSSLLQNLAPDSFYHDWVTHSQPDDYWEALSPKNLLQGVDLPMLHIGGWFDTFLRGTLNLYKAMATKSAHPQHLIVGPWAHLPWGRKVGALNFGIEANSPCDRLQIRWFNYFLKGEFAPLHHEPPIQLFEMGINEWRYFDTWNSTQPTAFYLESTGQAAMSDRDGGLRQVEESGVRSQESEDKEGKAEEGGGEEIPFGSTQASQSVSRRGEQNSPTPQPPIATPPSPSSSPSPSPSYPPDVLIHDPWRPVPALGGHAAYPSGPQERSTLDCRSDVLTYTSEPLMADLHVAGEVAVQVECMADAPSFDLCAVLSEVRPNGTVFNFTQGYIHVPPAAKTYPLHIPLQATCICLKAGSALRLSLSAACFPAYPVNAGTGASAADAHLIDQQIITITVQVGSDRASQVLLPIL
ncbi:MAG: CocE/NonD family hydrolase [Oscillatoriales cyanobacterium C42_A2020_001]|nr:CocE/NonD family hydrolase [Leptolyngbyaceae cyanobacterium C42_A2020_001]